ncbi:MAG: CCA tRNA nucleotidyltransferase [Campylobacterota bacterium]|nr:CCA tRNA nucleotidyltransferase [Campylobacterota bacterium]
MIDYPNRLNIIFDKLLNHSIKPIIIGGFIRDSLLKIESKDIDIELYGISSFTKLEKILEEFGSVNSVGKSFGVCKLRVDDLDLDFSFPRRDSKISKGHRGFSIEVDSSLDFKSATSRRDFSINAIGYDVEAKKIMDPFNGRKDLEKRVLRAVNLDTFIDDPLRVLRAVQFSSRFNLSMDKKLFSTCAEMINNSLLNELPRERIFLEMKKLLLKSSSPSSGLKLLRELGAFKFFVEFQHLDKDDFSSTLKAINKMSSLKGTDEKTNIVLMLATLCYKLPIKSCETFLLSLTTESSLINRVLSLIKHKNTFNIDAFKDYDIYLLATKLIIDDFVLFYLASTDIKEKIESILKLKKRAKELNVLNTEAVALLQGRDILKFGVKPSKEFSKILDRAYRAQINSEFKTKKEALVWLKKELAP